MDNVELASELEQILLRARTRYLSLKDDRNIPPTIREHFAAQIVLIENLLSIFGEGK